MIWADGRLQDGPLLAIAAGDRGLTLADGLFETILVARGRPHRLDEHLGRLAAGAAVLRFAAPLDEVRAAVLALAATEPGRAALRVTVTRGAGARGLALPAVPQPTVFGSIAPFDTGLVFRPVTLATSAIRRNEQSPLSRVKSLAYMDNVLALAEAVDAGAGDALLLNTAGRVACTSAGNLFAVVDGVLATPPVEDGVLPGIARAELLAAGRIAGLAVAERSLSPADLAAASAVFSTNSLRLVTPVTAIDGRAVEDRAGIAAAALALLQRGVDAVAAGGEPLVS
ncbi:aminotransferase class IV [Methylobrevis albus]|uniref:Probable branched-chain-amino-acid aminotransferase n=1 Tax=Methylobrevis albus TaxID=2793297 RepID=A0A931I6J3_9HYPH|nr:aminotransferase class IV [Methylobrevis albus]MBH0239736.1 aminotransferase class IV [Methylobrevis albus]